MIKPDSVISVNESVIYRVAEGKIHIINHTEVTMSILNTSATWIWQACTGKGIEFSELVSGYQQEFHLSKIQAEKDVTEFVLLQQEKGRLASKSGRG